MTLTLKDLENAAAELYGFEESPSVIITKMTDAQKPRDGYPAKSFKGIPIAIEWHADGSVTLSKEVASEIRETGDTSLLIPPPPGMIYMLNKDSMEFKHD